MRAYLSRLIALHTQTWMEEEENKTILPQDKRQNIDLDNCVKVFQEVKNWEIETVKNFSSHPFFETSYEDLTSNPQMVMTSIFSFFNLKSYPVSTNLKKQNSETIEELVINYQELKNRLTQEGYANFIEETPIEI